MLNNNKKVRYFVDRIASYVNQLEPNKIIPQSLIFPFLVVIVLKPTAYFYPLNIWIPLLDYCSIYSMCDTFYSSDTLAEGNVQPDRLVNNILHSAVQLKSKPEI